MTLINVLKQRSNTDPCGTSEETAEGDEKSPKIRTEGYRFLK
jgi:hypothetical protein